MAIDETSGVGRGDPQPLATPAWYVADFNLSADGTIGVYSSVIASNNVARVAFDSITTTIKGDVELITRGTNDFAQFDVTLDGRSIALTTSSRTKEDLYVFSFTDGSMRQLTNDFARDRFPRWSPDARSIYLYSDRRGYQVWRINADGSDLRQLTIGAELRMYPSPSPDGTRLAASDQDLRTLSIYDTRDFSKPLQVVTPPIEPKVGALQTRDWSPDGRSFLVQANSPTGSAPGLYTYNVDTGTTHRIGDCAGATWMKDGRRIVCLRMAGQLAVVVDVGSGRETQMELRGGGVAAQGGVRLAVDDTQLFFLTGSLSADIWVARFDQPARSQ